MADSDLFEFGSGRNIRGSVAHRFYTKEYADTFVSAYTLYADKQLFSYALHADNKLSAYTLYADKANQ